MYRMTTTFPGTNVTYRAIGGFGAGAVAPFPGASHMGYRAMSGFGAFNPSALGCGDIKWTQTALNALGFNAGAADGVWGGQTALAFAAYSASKVPTGTTGNCNTLQQDYNAKLGVGPGSQPPAATKCPEGQFSLFGTCVSSPFSTKPGGGQPGAQACPPGTTGIYPACFTLPGPGGGQPVPYQPPPPKPGLTTAQKIGIGAAVLAIGAVGLGIIFGKKKPAAAAKTATANLRRGRATRARRSRRGGTIVTVGKGRRKRRFGHQIPPKKYRRMGAVKKSQYAWPEGYKYPIHDYKHTRAALTRFSRWKGDYPLQMRRTIAKRLNAAKRKFGIGGEVVKP